MKRVTKRVKGIYFALMYVAIYYITSVMVYGAYYLWNLADGRMTTVEIEKSAGDGAYALTVIASIICLWIYMLIGRIRKISLEDAVKTKNVQSVVYIMSVFLAIGCRFLVSVYYELSLKSGILSKSIEDAAQFIPEITGGIQLMVAIFSVVIIAPLFEEFLFRGLVMTELKKIMRPWAAITLQAIIFGAVHGVLFQSIFAFVIGIALGIVYHRTENIKVTTLCHLVFNMSAVLVQENMTEIEMTVYSVIGILLVSLSLMYVFYNSKKGM